MDQVYALRGIADDIVETELIPDYGKSLTAVFAKAAAFLVKLHA